MPAEPSLRSLAAAVALDESHWRRFESLQRRRLESLRRRREAVRPANLSTASLPSSSPTSSSRSLLVSELSVRLQRQERDGGDNDAEAEEEEEKEESALLSLVAAVPPSEVATSSWEESLLHKAANSSCCSSAVFAAILDKHPHERRVWNRYGCGCTSAELLWRAFLTPLRNRVLFTKVGRRGAELLQRSVKLRELIVKLDALLRAEEKCGEDDNANDDYDGDTGMPLPPKRARMENYAQIEDGKTQRSRDNDRMPPPPKRARMEDDPEIEDGETQRSRDDDGGRLDPRRVVHRSLEYAAILGIPPDFLHLIFRLWPDELLRPLLGAAASVEGTWGGAGPVPLPLPMHFVAAHPSLAPSCVLWDLTRLRPRAASVPAFMIDAGGRVGRRLPLHAAIAAGRLWGDRGCVRAVAMAFPDALGWRDGITGLYPAMLAAAAASEMNSSGSDLDTIFELLRLCPQQVCSGAHALE